MSSSAAHLIRKGVAAKSSYKLGTNILPFTFFSSSFHYVCHKDRTFSPKPRIDFSCINGEDDVVLLFQEMVSMRHWPSVLNFNRLLSVIVKMKRYPVALYVFDEMCQRHFPANEYTLTIVMNCYCLLRRPDLGFAMLGSFFKCGYKPHVTTYNTFIKGLFLDDKVSEAEILFKKLLNLRLIEPDEVTILIANDGLCKVGKTLIVHDLLGLFEKTSYKPNFKSYSTLIDSLCKDGMVDDALHLFSEMIDNGISLDVVTYTSIIHGLCNFARWKDMENVLAEMADHNISLNVYTSSVLVDALCKEGNVQEAEDIVEIMMQRNVLPNIVTFNALINGYRMRGEMDKAREVFDCIEAEGLKPCIISYNALINGYCKKGMVDEAWRLFLEVPRKGLKHSNATYSTMIHGLLQEIC